MEKCSETRNRSSLLWNHYTKSVLVLVALVILSKFGFGNIFGYGGCCSFENIVLDTDVGGEHYSLVNVDNHIVGWWRGENSIDDESVNGNDGTLNGGATYATGKYGNAFSFDGDGDSVTVGNTGIPSGTTPISVSLWMKYPDTSANYCAYSEATNATENASLGICVNFFSANSLVITHAGGAYDWDTGVDLTTGAWYHIVYTAGPSGGSEKVYVNGSLVATRGSSRDFSIPTGPTVLIGNWNDFVPNNYYYKGQVDDVIVFNDQISDAAVLSLYNAQVNQYDAPFTGVTSGNHSLQGFAVKTDGTKYETTKKIFTASGSASLTLSPIVTTLDTSDIFAEHYSFVNFDSSLVGWWRGESNANDNSGSGNNGILNGNTTYATGKYGNAFSFDGTGDYVDVGDGADFDFYGAVDFTVSTWVKTTAGTTQFIFGRDSSDDSYAIGLTNSGNLYFQVFDSDNVLHNIDGSIAVNDGNWHHVAFQIGQNGLKSYVDGVLDVNQAGILVKDGTNSSAMIGRNPANPTQDFNGQIDEIMVFNRALSLSEITSLYKGMGLIGWWKGDNNASDSSGFGNTGTLNGNTTYTTGQYNQAFSLDGTGDYVSLPLTMPNGDATYSFWVYIDSIPETLFGYFIGSLSTPDNFSIRVEGTNGFTCDGKISFAYQGSPVEVCGSEPAVSDTWYHVAVVEKGAKGTLYIDGVEVANGVAPENISGDTLVLGAYGTSERYLNGEIDDVMVFNRALTSAEVASLYADQNDLPPGYSNTFITGAGSHTVKGYAVKTDATKYSTQTTETATAPGTKTLTLDTTVPTVSTLSPADNATDVALAANLVISFDEAVSTSTGNIVIKKTSDDSTVETIDVTSANVTGGGTDTITINPTGLLSYSTEYYVQIDATAFDDEAGNSYAGISDTTSWSFTTTANPDATAPTVSTLSPADDASDVAVDVNLVMTFSENVVVSTGNVTIKKTDDDSTVETIDITSGQVTGTGTDTITINPSSDFDNGTGYYVQVASTAIDDEAGNSYAGISDTTSWSFTTVSSIAVGSVAPTNAVGSAGGNPILFDQFNLRIIPLVPGAWYRVMIDDDAQTTSSRFVELKLIGGDAKLVTINEVTDKPSDLIYEDYVPVKSFKLSEGDGLKKIVVRFYNKEKQLLAVIPASIILDSKILNPVGGMNIFDIISKLISKVGFGDQNDNVSRLQERLKQTGLFLPKTTKVTGYYGNLTRLAVDRFKNLMNMSTDDLIKVTRRGETSVYVMKLQLDLQKLKLFPPTQEITGFYGLLTEGAVGSYKMMKRQ